jgi:hypothetical protein
MKSYPQGLSGIFMTVPLLIPDDMLASLAGIPLIVNLNLAEPKRFIFERKSDVPADEVTLNLGGKTATFKLRSGDLSNIGQHRLQVFFASGNLFVPSFKGEFSVTANNARS